MIEDEIKWIASTLTAEAVMIQARQRIAQAEEWAPLFEIGDIDTAAEALRVASIVADNSSIRESCENLLVSRKQQGIDVSLPFVGHGSFQPMHAGLKFGSDFVHFVCQAIVCVQALRDKLVELTRKRS